MNLSWRRICVLGCLLLSSGILPTNAQFAQHVAGHLQHLGSQPLFSATVVQPNQPSSDGPVFIQPRIQETFFQPGIELPKCPYARVLSTQGVPARWAHMTLEQQAADPVNAAVVQLAYVAWQEDARITLGRCLDNLGIKDVVTVHKLVLPYLGTMTAVVMRAGDKGVFLSFRGTDFEDKGDILVDGDCQYTDNKGEYFGSKRDIRLHTGFFRAWESVAPQVTAHMLRQLQQTSTKKVYLVGHSLGAAMAAIAALRLNHLLQATDARIGGVWLFGCPRVGDPAWKVEYNAKLLTRTVRMANFGDFASRLPRERQICTSTTRLLDTFSFRHVGRAVVLCPDAGTGLTRWRLFQNGSETLDCGPRPDPPDYTVTTHWLGPYLDAWRRAHAATLPASSLNELATNPWITSVVCRECSLSFPDNKAKQLNVPARAGGPVGCCTSASCSLPSAFEAVVRVAGRVSRPFNPESVCQGFICT